MNIIELEQALSQRYPDLRLITDKGKPFFRGSFPIIHNDQEIDRFLIEIHFPKGIKNPPAIYEIGGRIPRTQDRHVFGEGQICVEAPDLITLRGYSFLSFLEGPVRNYFIGQGFAEAGEPWPFGEWKHGKPGLIQAYGQELGCVVEEGEVRRYLDCLSHEELKGHWPCPCGSGKKIRQCHVEALRKLHSIWPPHIARQAIERLNMHNK